MEWVLFGTYYYDKLRYFTLSRENHYADKPRNIGIYGILPKDAKYKRLDSIPVRVTNCNQRRTLAFVGVLFFCNFMKFVEINTLFAVLVIKKHN